MQNLDIMKKLKNLIRHKKLWLLLGVLLLTMTNCLEQEPKVWAPDDISLQIAEYIELNSDRFSEFNEMIIRTDFVHLLKARGPYTLFLPTNEAMQNFYTKKGISSIDGLTLDEMERLVRTHLFAFLIPTGAIGLGSLPDTNALGDFISSEFQGSDILISKHSKIIKRDIINANGYIHVIDRVIEPITKTIYKVISEDSDYSIFVAGLERTGLSTVLETISGPYGNTTVRIWFTLLAVSDAIYNASSINSVDDLIQEYSDGILPLTNPENGFYKYMEYHCLEGVHYLSAIRNGIYPGISREKNITIRITVCRGR